MDAAMAALFPNAFSDSALGAIPRGWIQAQLSQAIAIRDGKPWASDNRVDISKVKVFGANGPVGFALEALETGRVVFLGKIGSCGALNSFNGEWWATNNVFYISQTLNRELEWCRHVLMTIDFKGYIGGSSNPYMPLKNFGHHPILVPPVELRSKFESMTALYRAKIEANQKQADSLAQVRDALLPRLISGKLRLPEAQERVEDALA
jgi:type I restriction enzyme S subunit